MVSFLSWLLLVMAVGEGLHANLVSGKPMIVSNSAIVTAYWKTMLPNTPMPSAILELVTPPGGNDDVIFKHVTANIQSAATGQKDVIMARKIRMHSIEQAGTKMGKFQGQGMKFDNNKNVPFYWWGPSTFWDQGMKIDNNNNVPFYWWGPSTTPDQEMKIDKNKNVPFYWWGPSTSRDQGKEADNNKNTPFYWWDPSTSRDQGKETDNNKNTPFYRWGPSTSRDQRKETDDNKNTPFYRWGPARKADDQKSASNVQEDDEHVVGGEQLHKHVTSWPDMVLLEEALTLGSMITPYVPASSSTSGAPLLRRDAADSIPLSTENLADILTMLGPAAAAASSHAMAEDIRSTLRTCEHPRRIKGEKKACAASLESMVEFAASVLIARGTTTSGGAGHLRALSSPGVPAEGMTSGRRYEVTAVRRATAASSELTMTCHGMSFPYAVFMCHAVNPTRVYKVALESEEDGHKVEALAVCHLDTSEFDPRKMPGNVKPGDAPVCHFISRDSVLWAPAA